MSILNPTPQEIEDDKSPLYTKAAVPAKTRLDDIVEKAMDEALSTVTQKQLYDSKRSLLEEVEKYSTNIHSGKIFIVAGTRAEYTAWVERNGYKYTETQYVQNANSLRGIENIKGFYIGTYASRPDIQDIMSVIATSKRRTSWADGTTVATGFNPQTGMLDADATIHPTRPAEYPTVLAVDATISKNLTPWSGTTTYIGGSGGGGTISNNGAVTSSVGSVAALSYEQMRSRIRVELRDQLHDEIETLSYGDATRAVILAAIDRVLDKY
jgi:hypothetical protein